MLTLALLPFVAFVVVTYHSLIHSVRPDDTFSDRCHLFDGREEWGSFVLGKFCSFWEACHSMGLPVHHHSLWRFPACTPHHHSTMPASPHHSPLGGCSRWRFHHYLHLFILGLQCITSLPTIPAFSFHYGDSFVSTGDTFYSTIIPWNTCSPFCSAIPLGTDTFYLFRFLRYHSFLPCTIPLLFWTSG